MLSMNVALFSHGERLYPVSHWVHPCGRDLEEWEVGSGLVPRFNILADTVSSPSLGMIIMISKQQIWIGKERENLTSAIAILS